VLFIGLIAALFALLPTVRNAGFLQNRMTTGQPVLREPEAPIERDSTAGQDTPRETPITAPPAERPPVETPLTNPPAATERPAEQIPPATTQAAQPPATQPADRPAETRDRNVYFMQEARGGSELLPTKVNRKLAVSDSPLLDSLNALLAGPTTDEKNRGLIDCIPPGTRVIRLEMRGNTAYINFNEQFQYNTGGREDYAAQIKQIVWTATEFSNVHDVQILIEGNRVDFLGEGIMIGSPLKR
jgi:spore germination protein GerM